MDGTIGTSDYVDVYGRKPSDQKPPENETNLFMQRYNFLKAFEAVNRPNKKCIALYFNTGNHMDQWEKSSFMNVYDTDCSDLLKSDARGIIGLSHSRDEMNVICESPTISKFALSVSKFLLFNNKYEELLTT